MPGVDTKPEWNDGQASRDLLDSLDAMGGKGADMGDQDVFLLLDEVERLSKERLHAAELLAGNGMANNLAEPRLGAGPKTVQNALIAEQLAEFARTADRLSGAAPQPAQGAKEAEEAEEAEEFAAMVAAKPAPLKTPPAQATTPTHIMDAAREARATSSDHGSLRTPLPGLPEMSPFASAAKTPVPATPARTTAPAQMVESKEIASPGREMELGQKRKTPPENFLPPDFFDPRDRKPKVRWGLWITLGVVIVSMLLLAAFMIKKNYLDNRPMAPRGYGDLTQPARK